MQTALADASPPASPAGDIDYDALYRALDLPPGAALRDIQDRARLLGAAFDLERLPPGLRSRTKKRRRIVDRAADELSRYWKTRGTPPPTAAARHAKDNDPLDVPEEFFIAVAETLDSRTRLSAIRLVSQAAARGQPAVAVPQAGRGGLSATAHDCVAATCRAGSADQTIAVLHPRGAARPMPRPISPPAAVSPLPSGTRSRPAEPLAAIAGRPTGRPASAGSRQTERRPVSFTRYIAVRAALAALVVAAVIRVAQYRAEHPYLTASAEPYATAATGLPAEPPSRWAGLAGFHQPTGAAAPAIGGHQR